MIRKIIKIAIAVALIVAVLYIGGYSFDSFSHQVELKDPSVFQPLVQSAEEHLEVPEVSMTFETQDLPEGDFEVIRPSTNVLTPVPEEEITTETSVYRNPLVDSVSIDYTRNLRITINGQSTDLTSNTSVTFIRWLCNAYTEDAEITYEDLAVQYNDVLESEADLTALVGSINVVDELPDLDGYDRNTFERPVRSYTLNGETYNRNDYAWATSEFLVSENPYEYICPYTGQSITDESTLDYDHIVPLHSAYLRGASEWTQDEQNEYAYNQWVGVDVLNSANRSKSDKGPIDYLPQENIEDYCYSWLLICSYYHLDMTQEEIDICVTEIEDALEIGETVEHLGGAFPVDDVA